MIQKKTIEELINQNFIFIDVRSPSEFKRGHIPGSFNIPLLSDQLRALVGTIYVQEGKQKAIHVALEHVGPHFTDLIDQGKRIYDENKKTLVIYCARGGMRSGAVAWLFNLFGLPVVQLEHGYKAYRNWALAQFTKKQKLNILSGKTGSGKTEILHKMKLRGEQVIDLEKWAEHKGSVFGGDKRLQATQQQFENDLAWHWAQLNQSTITWIEDESRKIGAVIIPEAVWLQMQDSPAYLLERSFEERLQRILDEYGSLDKDFLFMALSEIKDHLGSELYYRVKALIMADDLKNAYALLLEYYDKKYKHGISKKRQIFPLGAIFK